VKILNWVSSILIAFIPMCSEASNVDPDAFELIAGENGDYRGVNEIIGLQIPTNFTPERFKNIVIELDNLDITAMLKNDNAHISYQPVQSLSPGKHELRVVEYSDDGDISELGFWSFEVRQSQLFQQYSIAADTQLSASQRIASNNIGEPEPNKFQGQANSQIGFSATSGDWKTEGQFDLYYDSVKENQLNGRSIDNNTFLFSTGNRYVNARIGHHNIGISNLVMNNFQRRGFSLQGKIPSINSRVSGFSLSSADISGFGHGLGISNQNQRVDGVTFDSSPFSENPRSLYISGTWLQGRSIDSGNFVAQINDPLFGGTKGNAWSFSGESLFLDNKLRLRAEYAATDYDFNQADEINSDSDNAHSFLLTYNDVTDDGTSWNLGVANQKIGTFFRSLANQTLPSDKKLVKAFAGAQWATFGFQLNLEQQQDNVENIALLPRVQTDVASFLINWSPTITNKDSWLGTPNFALGTSYQSQEQTFTPLNYFLPVTDNQIQNWQFSSNFAYLTNSWGLSVTNTNFSDGSLVQNNTETLSFNWFASFLFGEEQDFSLSPAIAFNNTKDKTTNLDFESITYSVQSAFVVIPKKLDIAVDFILNQNQTSDDSLNADSLAANISVNWHISEANVNEFGFDLNFSVMYNDFENKIFSTDSLEVHQVFLTLTAILPSRVGKTNE